MSASTSSTGSGAMLEVAGLRKVYAGAGRKVEAVRA
jgi:hypothetical protein